MSTHISPTKSPSDFTLPVNKLDEEFRTWQRPILPHLAWLGVRLYESVLESA